MFEEVATDVLLIYGLGGLLAVIGITILTMLYQSGAFASITVKTCKPCLGEVKIAYKFAHGAYDESSYLYTEAHSILPNYNTIGVYYEAPKKVNAGHLKYIVGLVLNDEGHEVKPEDEKLLTEKGFKFATLPAVNHAVQTTFPFYNTISIIFAVMRVYSVLSDYIKSKKLCAYPYIEYYNSSKNEIVFIAPLEKQDQFSVPEAIESDSSTHEDDESSVSWDDSSIRTGRLDVDSDSLAGDSSFNNLTAPTSPSDEIKPIVDESPKDPIVTGANEPIKAEESDNSDSSYEKLDSPNMDTV